MSHHTSDSLVETAKQLFEQLSLRMATLKPKERMAIPAQEMPTQPPLVRAKNFGEVAIGYTAEQARVEAARCLQCKNAPCVAGCPVRIRIPEFIKAAAEGDFAKSIGIIKESSVLPAVCGRVCPQESQCQEPCTLGKSLKDVEKAVSIGRIERFVADWERENGTPVAPVVKPDTGMKVAIVGSGPAGLTVAGDVRREGHAVTIFEAFQKAGGVMTYGIPEFRLPKKIVAIEVAALAAMGVEIRTDFVVGRTRKLMDLMERDGFDAVFVGTGAGLPKFMNIEGESLVGVFTANEYLTRVNLMKAYDTASADTPLMRGRRVAVLGGGNVAMDAARTAVRMGSEEVHIVYRRTEAEMPARVEEVHHAKEEGVIFHVLQNAKRIIGDDRGRVQALECLRYELGSPDKSGRPRPVEIKGSEFNMDVDVVIVAIGNESNPLIKMTTPSIKTNEWGNIIADEHGATSVDGVYAGGDIVLGAATVILAMGQGRIAAKAINERLVQKLTERHVATRATSNTSWRTEVFKPMPRAEVVKAVERRNPCRIPLAFAHWWGDGLWDQYGERLNEFNRYPEDVRVIGIPKFDVNAMKLSWKIEGGRAHDSNLVIDDWAKLDEFIEKLPDPSKDPVFEDCLVKDAAKVHSEDLYLIVGWWGLFFETLWGLRGMENLLADYYENPDKIHRLSSALCDVYCRSIGKAAEVLKPDGYWTSDDLGHQTQSMMSPETFDVLLKPYYCRMGEFLRQKKIHWWLHSCGNNTPLMQSLIDSGVRMFHPVQKHTMDEKEIFRKYGSKLGFWAGFDVQHTLREGTPEQVRAEVRFLIDTFDGPGGGMSIAAGNGIVSGTPFENIEAFLDEAVRYGRKHRE